MKMILEGLRNSYFAVGVKRHIRRSRPEFLKMEDAETFRTLNIVAVSLLVVAAGLYMAGGYHVGFHSLNQWTPYLPSDFWQMTTFIGDTSVPLCLTLFFVRRNPALLWVVFIAALYGLFLSHGMKAYFGAMRPPAVLSPEEFNLVGHGYRSRSFPSGHSVTISIFVSILFYFSSQLNTRISLLCFGAVVALSRVMVAAHWPIDVLVGSAIGILVTLAAVYTAKRWRWGFSQRAHYFIVALLLIATMTLYFPNAGYPRTYPFAVIVATTALAFFISEYFVTPYVKSRSTKAQRVN